MFTDWENPWESLRKFHHQMNRMFDERVFGGRFMPAFVRRRAPFPRVNLAETVDALTVTCELPGVTTDSLDVSLRGRELTIAGERLSPECPDRKYHRRERGFGPFSRTIELPGELNPDALTASLKHGVLTVRLAKPPETKAKQIEVKTGD